MLRCLRWYSQRPLPGWPGEGTWGSGHFERKPERKLKRKRKLEMKTSELRPPSDTLTAAELNGKAHRLTITDYEIREYEETDKKTGQKYTKKKAVISFHGAEKKMVVNVTNSRAIESMYGEDMDDWRGKSIVIQPEITDFEGRSMPCIRVRAEIQEAEAPLGGEAQAADDAFVSGPEAHFDNPSLGPDDPFNP